MTPNYSTFDTRSEFDGAGVVDSLNGFDEFNVDAEYFPQESPWTTHGVTYTSATNAVIGRVVELGIQSAAISTDFGAPISGTFADSNPFTLFGANLMLIGEKVPVALLVRTNLGSYSFNLDVPLAADGQRFFGIALSKPGEHLTGFQFSVSASRHRAAARRRGGWSRRYGRNERRSARVVGGPYSARKVRPVGLR